MACSLLEPHISGLGCKEMQTAGRVGSPNNWHLPLVVSCMHLIPASLFPLPGIPGIGPVMDGAIQQAAHLGRQRIEFPSGLVIGESYVSL